MQANHVLEQALKPNINGMPKSLFKESVGIAIISTVEVGCIFSGTVGKLRVSLLLFLLRAHHTVVLALARGLQIRSRIGKNDQPCHSQCLTCIYSGSGIIMKKTDKGWSPPCACGMSGLSFGILLGISAKDLIIFILDDITMKTFAADHKMTIGSQLEVTVGFGRSGQADLDFSKKGFGSTFAVAYTKGAFAGLSVSGSQLGVREFVNNKFYNAETSAKKILYSDPEGVVITESKVTMINEVYDKLNKLQAGETAEPDGAEAAKKQAAKEAADKESESVKNTPSAEVVMVDAAAEAAKEPTSK